MFKTKSNSTLEVKLVKLKALFTASIAQLDREPVTSFGDWYSFGLLSEFSILLIRGEYVELASMS